MLNTTVTPCLVSNSLLRARGLTPGFPLFTFCYWIFLDTVMFYSEAILSRRGPLAKVWLAAHMERKLSKTQTLQTDIEESVDAIMGQEVEIMALRLSGQLLLGVVRIYSRKAKYLLDDCNEALLKIKMAFRPGMVDMTEDQLAVNRNAITLQGNNIDFDLMLSDFNNFDIDFEDRLTQGGQHVARMADITLASANDFLVDFDNVGFDFDFGPGDGIGSQDLDVDLGIDFGDGPIGGDANRTGVEDETMSVEVGRDAAIHRSPRESLDSHMFGKGIGDADILSVRSRAVSENPFNPDIDMDYGGDLGGMDLDLGIDFGDAPIADITLTEAAAAEARSPSRASSRLTTPPPTPPQDPFALPQIDANGQENQETPTKKRKFMNKKQIIDSVTELESGPGINVGRGRNANNQVDVSGIVTKHNFLPRSRNVMRLLEIRQDPLAHFLPTKATPNGNYFCAAPPGLAPELTEMFMRPIENILGPKRRENFPDKPNKKARLDKENVEDVEQARRAGSLAPSMAMGSDILHQSGIGAGDFDQGLDFGDNLGGMDDYRFDVDMNADINVDRARSKSRFSTPAADGELFDDLQEGETYADASCPISMFDDRQSQSQQESAAQEGKGYSRTTVKALSVVRKELQPSSSGEQEKVMSFQQMSHKASRRAASTFFFELLVLGTRDCVKLSQGAAYENIEVRAKDKLWERQRHASVAPSVAPSVL